MGRDAETHRGEVTGAHVCASQSLRDPPASSIAHFFLLLGSPGKGKSALSQVRAHVSDSPPCAPSELQIPSQAFSTDSGFTQSHSPLPSVLLTQPARGKAGLAPTT